MELLGCWWRRKGRVWVLLGGCVTWVLLVGCVVWVLLGGCVTWVLLGGCVTWVLVVGGKKPVPQSALAAAVQGANCSKTDAEK